MNQLYKHTMIRLSSTRWVSVAAAAFTMTILLVVAATGRVEHTKPRSREAEPTCRRRRKVKTNERSRNSPIRRRNRTAAWNVLVPAAVLVLSCASNKYRTGDRTRDLPCCKGGPRRTAGVRARRQTCLEACNATIRAFADDIRGRGEIIRYVGGVLKNVGDTHTQHSSTA